MKLHGFVVSGPRGIFPGTFSLDQRSVMKRAPAVAILNRYPASEVVVREAVLTVSRSARRYPIAERMQRKIDKANAERAAAVQKEANRVRRGRR